MRSGLILAGLVLVLALSGCGGGGSSGSSNSGQQGQDQAQVLLKKAGLEACTKTQATAAAWYGTGFVQGRTFVVAPDCNNPPAVPTYVSGLTYKDNDTADQAAKSIKKTHPSYQLIQPTVAPYTTTVIAVYGPKAKEYAASIEKVIPKAPSSSQSTQSTTSY